MIHILLTILKIIGIILLVLLGTILTLLLLILFVPIRYRIHAGIHENSVLQLLLEQAPLITDEEKLDLVGDLELTAAVTWLLKLVRVTVKFFQKKLNFQVKVACFSILSSEPKEKKSRKTSAKKRPEKKAEEDSGGLTDSAQEPVSQLAVSKTGEGQETADISGEKEPQPQPQTQPSQEQPPRTETETEPSSKEKKPKKELSETMEELSGKVNNILDMVNDKDNQALVIMALKSLKKLLWHIRPRRYYCYLYYGADDPSVTGKMMMAYGIAKGAIGLEHLEITPDFERKIIKLSAETEGRIRLIHIAVIACKIFFNKTFRKLIGGKKNGRQ